MKDIKKLYYSISEVSEMTGLKQYVLRYWETEFTQLTPPKNKAGNRTYRKSDIECINNIKDLLYKKKFTIDGARQFLKRGNKDKGDSNPSAQIDNSQHLKVLNQLKSELEEIQGLIKKLK